MSGRHETGHDWLFDGEGEPGAAERELADSLRPLRWEGDPERLMERLHAEVGRGGSEGAAQPEPTRRRQTIGAGRRLAPRHWAMLAAGAVLVGVSLWAFLPREQHVWTKATGGGWAVGSWLETARAERVEVASDIGRVTVGPGSRVRLKRAASREHRLELAEGSIDAFIYAPPRLFFVDTPGATAVDMGCAYTLEVAEDGSGLLRVTGGWVELQAEPLASRVPAGAVCRLGPGGAPGLPVFEDAPAPFAAAVERLDRGDDSAIEAALRAARPRDGLTLWHLGARLDGSQHAAVFDRLAALVPPPAGLLERVFAGEAAALEEWWAVVRAAW